MILVNAKYGAFHRFFDIQFVGGKWFAWYFRDLDANDVNDVNEIEGGEDGGN
jgi:hypothetical protein